MTEEEFKIQELEELAKLVLQAKKTARPRRPIVIEFCGTPKAGKSSCVSSLNLFLKRNGFKTKVLSERASICPIQDKYNPSFNLWNFFSSSAELLENFVEKSKEIDVILCDRSVFDSLCWFQWFQQYDHINDDDFTVIETFLTMNRFRSMFDLIYIFKTSSKVALDREYANLLTRKTGSIMNDHVLSEYNTCLDIAKRKYEEKFRCIREINTDNLNQNAVSYEVTKDVLTSLYELVIEKVAYIDRDSISKYENKNYWFEKSFISNLDVKFDYRDQVEENSKLVQPLPIIVLTNKRKSEILVAKKKSKSLSKNSPEKDNLLAYFGGHIRIEDMVSNDFNKTIFNALSREIQEELGLSLNIASSNKEPLFIWLKDNERSEKHLAICYLYQADFTHHKIKLDEYEFIQKTGTSESGRIINLRDIDLDKFEKWSKIILYELLNIRGGQLSLFERTPIFNKNLDTNHFEILEENKSKLVDNYYIYITPEELDKIELSDFVYMFRKHYSNREKSNIYIIDDRDIYPLIKKYPLVGEEYLCVADHFVAMSSFDIPDIISMYPYQDFYYKELGGEKIKDNI